MECCVLFISLGSVDNVNSHPSEVFQWSPVRQDFSTAITFEDYRDERKIRSNSNVTKSQQKLGIHLLYATEELKQNNYN